MQSKVKYHSQKNHSKNKATAQQKEKISLVKKSSKKIKTTVYKNTLKDIRREMTPTERIFSKIIHNPLIEKISDIVSSTIARPGALILGSLSALILLSIIYIMAQYYGWALSGSEWIAAFVAGWCAGLIIDWLRIAIFGKRAGPA